MSYGQSYYFFETQENSYLEKHVELKNSFFNNNIETFNPKFSLKVKVEIKTLIDNFQLNNLSNSQWKDLILFVEEIN